MSISKQPHILDKEPPNKPAFKLPEGYTMGWKETFVDGKKIGWHVLRNPQGEELGTFAFVPGETVEVVLKSHLGVQVVKGTRETTTVLIVLKDSYDKDVGKWELHQHAKNPIEVLVKYLSNR